MCATGILEMHLKSWEGPSSFRESPQVDTGCPRAVGPVSSGPSGPGTVCLRKKARTALGSPSNPREAPQCSLGQEEVGGHKAEALCCVVWVPGEGWVSERPGPGRILAQSWPSEAARGDSCPQAQRQDRWGRTKGVAW